MSSLDINIFHQRIYAETFIHRQSFRKIAATSTEVNRIISDYKITILFFILTKMNLLKKFLSDELHLNPEIYLSDFMKYEKLLLEWNTKINLVSRKTNSIEDHILNSIFFLTKFNFENIKSIADIGTGGGFPGIPLKILYPGLKLLLVDSIQKKINVLNDIIEKMELKNTEAVCGRAEIVCEEAKYKNKFDCVISKAVAGLDKLYEWGSSFLNDKGTMICIKGGDIEKEITELKKLRYNFKVEVINFNFESGFGIEDKKIVLIKTKPSE